MDKIRVNYCVKYSQEICLSKVYLKDQRRQQQMFIYVESSTVFITRFQLVSKEIL